MTTKIMLVDDEPDLLSTLEYSLKREGFDLVTATNGYEALGVARIHQPDLILLDVMLPGENGYRIARMIREDEGRGVYPKKTPIILMTARDLSSDPDREKMFMDFSQADLMLYKPFELPDLLTRIRELTSAEN